jgi:membrane protease YdiL (CAAX protease family)
MPEGRDRRILVAEILVVLGLFVLPNLAGAIRSYLDPQHRTGLSYVGASLARIVSYCSVLPAVIFIAWRSGTSLSCYGLTGFRWWLGVSLTVGAVAIAIGMARGVNYLAMEWFPALNRSSSSHQISVLLLPKSLLDYTMMTVTMLLGSLTEEIIMRGYLITRLRELIPSTLAATVIAAMLFASYHIYQGPIAMFSVFLLGLVFSVPLLITKSIWPGTIAHALYNVSSQTILR